MGSTEAVWGGVSDTVRTLRHAFSACRAVWDFAFGMAGVPYPILQTGDGVKTRVLSRATAAHGAAWARLFTRGVPRHRPRLTLGPPETSP